MHSSSAVPPRIMPWQAHGAWRLGRGVSYLLPRVLGLGLLFSLVGGNVGCQRCSNEEPRGNERELSHGALAGEVDHSSVVIWGRGEQGGWLKVELRGAGASRRGSARLDAARDHTARVEFQGLASGTDYHYDAWITDHEAMDEPTPPPASSSGIFRTAFAQSLPARVRFAFSGDLAGQNACRDSERGFPIFNAISEERLDFFIGLGDMIYADGLCEATGTYFNPQLPRDAGFATLRPEFWRHWRYNRADYAFQQLLQATAYYPVWDDHEVVNDFGPRRDQRGNPPYRVDQHLMPEGLAAFMDYHAFGSGPDQHKSLYRARRWGKHVELFLLDARQYRDVASIPGDNPTKSMLGKVQLDWLLRSLRQSDATWKFIVSSVPLSIPTGWPPDGPRDGWANFGGPTGYEQELAQIVRVLPELSPANVVFLTADVHFAAAFTYRPFKPASGPRLLPAASDLADFSFLELVAGPLSAGLFPKLIYDDSFGPERLFIHTPAHQLPVETFDEALAWFNFAVVDVDVRGHMRVLFRDGNGRLIQELSVQPGEAASLVQQPPVVPELAPSSTAPPQPAPSSRRPALRRPPPGGVQEN